MASHGQISASPRSSRKPVKKPRICIVAHNAYGALCGGTKGHIGGAEWQTSLMAKWFADQGHETSLVTWDHGQPDGELVSGVKVWKTCAANAGWPGVRFFYPRLTGLYSALRRADAEIYYQNSAEYVTGQAAYWCRRNGKRFVYSSAAELACDVRLPLLRKPYERWLYRHGVRRADLRIVQTQKQQELLRAGWGLTSVLLPMPCPGPSVESFQIPEPPNPPRVIWVGRVDSNKRLDWFLDIAEKLPAIRFEIAAAINTEITLSNRLVKRAGCLPNVGWQGSVPREKMPEFYRGASCLCCTSIHEGFPNVFIEAWSHGVPLVTTFDPDGLAERLKIGIAASDIVGLAGAVGEICSNSERWRAYSKRARDYYLQNHQADVSMKRFQAEFHRLMASRDSAADAIKPSRDAVFAKGPAVNDGALRNKGTSTV